MIVLIHKFSLLISFDKQKDNKQVWNIPQTEQTVKQRQTLGWEQQRPPVCADALRMSLTRNILMTEELPFTVTHGTQFM